MQSAVPRGEPSIAYEQELEARIQALEAIVGALLRFSAGQQDLASALKEARHRSEAFMRDPNNNIPPGYEAFYRGVFHNLAVSMIPLNELESFRSSVQDLAPVAKTAGDEDTYANYPT
jgi:hypothetical protein